MSLLINPKLKELLAGSLIIFLMAMKIGGVFYIQLMGYCEGGDLALDVLRDGLECRCDLRDRNVGAGWF
jgi:hypothetical protein